MVDKTYEPLVVKDKKAGQGQLGTYVGAEIDKDGISSKVAKDTVVVSTETLRTGEIKEKALVPPVGMKNGILMAGYDMKCIVGYDYTPTVESKDTLCTFKFSFKTVIVPLEPGTYGEGAERSDSNLPKNP